jgi:hypothetical protein
MAKINPSKSEYEDDDIMPAATPFIGLCITCNNAEHCVYRKRRGTDAIYCEMFDDYTPPPAHGNGRAAAPAIVSTPESHSIVEPEGLKGLCINCANRNTCRLPRPKGGVWHCEEYA